MSREIILSCQKNSYLSLGVNPPACQPLSNLGLLAENANSQFLHGSGMLGGILTCFGLQKLAFHELCSNCAMSAGLNV